jgi:cyclase
MLRPRLIPCLLVRDGGLVKTVQFSKPKYVGDPINVVKIFNEKEVDELIVLDISATAKGREPDYTMIRNLAAECRMPLCYGGGINALEQAKKIVSMGVEKVAISASAIANPELISRIAKKVGSQSVVVVIDAKIKAAGRGYEIWSHNGTRATGLSPVTFAKEAERLGAGEIVINSIDRDGMMSGYDLELVSAVRAAVNLPITVLGGAKSFDDMRRLFSEFGIIGAGAGSMFVFKGVYRAVLVNYPSRLERDRLQA